MDIMMQLIPVRARRPRRLLGRAVPAPARAHRAAAPGRRRLAGLPGADDAQPAGRSRRPRRARRARDRPSCRSSWGRAGTCCATCRCWSSACAPAIPDIVFSTVPAVGEDPAVLAAMAAYCARAPGAGGAAGLRRSSPAPGPGPSPGRAPGRPGAGAGCAGRAAAVFDDHHRQLGPASQRQQALGGGRGFAPAHVLDHGVGFGQGGPWSGSSGAVLEVKKATLRATPRLVSGCRVAAAAATAVVMPGTTSTSMPASSSARSSSSARPNSIGSPPFRRTTSL
jgi:hypothetical protein